MTQTWILLGFTALLLMPPPARTAASPFAGRWDLTFTTADASYPSWMEVAEKEGHHPDILLSWGKAEVTTWTHSVDGLTESDFILAAKIDRIKT